MPDDGYGFLVMGFGPGDGKVAPGEEVATYELLEPVGWRGMRPHQCDEATVAYGNSVLDLEQGDEAWKVVRSVRCVCQSPREVAQILMHLPTERLWAMSKGEKVPNPFKRDGDGTPDHAPLHGRPGEQPCPVGISTCRGCSRQWAILATHDDLVAVRVRKPHRGARVVSS